ncbi:MAG TPA: type I phosphomannose isomerase catalytic subunit, partial [Acidobacteriaceae bacterium]|nr:type I phosphomannose isomerase catalytic subunit [Acidobacteriaceae bacterium]
MTSSEQRLPPFRLRPVFSERIWGRQGLGPWYPEAPAEKAIGEAWLTGPACVIETGPLAGKTLAEAVAAHRAAILGGIADADFPLLVKMLFPEEKLSVQVHPDDAAAQAMGQPRGKTECWYVLEAEPGATVALGLKPWVSAEDVRRGAADETMEELLEWLPVEVGDMVFVDAGTMHAIGPGVVLLEIQQTSDTTYRVYDYGRPRELHLDDAIRVMKTGTRAGKVPASAMDGFTRLIAQQYFVADRFAVTAGSVELAAVALPQAVIALKGEIAVSGDGGEAVTLKAGQAAVAPAS